jgi:hypothetical protein
MRAIKRTRTQLAKPRPKAMPGAPDVVPGLLAGLPCPMGPPSADNYWKYCAMKGVSRRFSGSSWRLSFRKKVRRLAYTCFA